MLIRRKKISFKFIYHREPFIDKSKNVDDKTNENDF